MRNEPTRKSGSRSARATASSKGGSRRPRAGSTRATAAEITARNARIVKLREVDRVGWEEIGERFGIDEKTARCGYDAHVASREHLASFEQAMRDMREYVAVLRENQRTLAGIAHGERAESEATDGTEMSGAARERSVDVRAQIAAMHEMVDQMFKEVAVRQAIGELPLNFRELSAAADFEWAVEQVMAVLKQHAVPREVFLDIQTAIASRIDVDVPKTHLAAVN